MDNPVSARAALLQALISGPGYGLELIERVETRSRGAVTLGQGSIYPALRDLEEEGMVRSYDGESIPERAGRPRRYYELTAEGAREARKTGRAMVVFFGPALPVGA